MLSLTIGRLTITAHSWWHPPHYLGERDDFGTWGMSCGIGPLTLEWC